MVVFPSPYQNNESVFFLLKNTAAIPDMITGNHSMEYVAGYVYCFLPSSEESKGKVSVFSSRPSFLDQFSYSLEINKQFIDIKKIDTVLNAPGNKVDKPEISGKCAGCFVSYFPSPNTSICKWKKKKKRNCIRSNNNSWSIRLRGGAKTVDTLPIIDLAISSARVHGINIHAGVRNLANGNCAF